MFKSAGFKIPVQHQVSRQIKGERSTVPRELSLRTAVAYHPTRRRHAVSLVQSVTPESSQCRRDCGPSVSEHTRTPPRTRGPVWVVAFVIATEMEADTALAPTKLRKHR